MTGSLTAWGHEVCVANYRGPETLAGLAKQGWRSRLPGHRDSRIREIELGLPGKPVNGKAIGQIRGNAGQLKEKGHTQNASDCIALSMRVAMQKPRWS